MNVTIAHVTSRLEPCWDWFADSLVSQLTPEELKQVQVIFIDRHLWKPEFRTAFPDWRDLTKIQLESTEYHDPARWDKLEAAVRGRFDFQFMPPKPNVWQGAFRLTTKDWFTAAQARNTAIMASERQYFVGVDDLSVLLPGWAIQVRHAAQNGYCVCGAYKKVKKLVVEGGKVASFEEYPGGVDTRWNRGSDGGIVPWSGSGLFGCSFGMPVELLLTVNGFDEATDGQSAEDYDLGIRAQRAGGKFFYNRNMTTYESEEMHFLDAPLPRESKLVLPERLPAGYEGNPMSDHVMLNRVTREERVTTLGGVSLRELRAQFLDTSFVPIPRTPDYDWRDGKPLAEM